MKKDLASIPMFADLPEQEFSRLAEIVEVREFDKGDVLFWEGDLALGLYCIKSGAVQVSKTNYDGKHAILQIYGPGDVLAEAVVFAQEPYPGTAEAVETSTVYFIGAEAIEDLILRYPTLALYIIKILGKRLRAAQNKIKDWSFTNAENRVAKLLFDLALRYGQPEVSGLAVAMDLPHARLAALSGLTRETVSRVLSAWRSQGIIGGKQRKIIIRNMAKLKNHIKE